MERSAEGCSKRLFRFEDAGDEWEELWLRDPRFEAEIAQVRQSLKDGKGISIEDLRAKYDRRSPVGWVDHQETQHSPTSQ